MNQNHLIKNLAEEMNWNQKKAKKFIAESLQWIKNNIKKSQVISISSFGIFEMTQRSEKTVIHPISKKSHQLEAKYRPLFSPSKKTTTQINREEY